MQMLLSILEIDYNLRKESCNYYLEVKHISDINFATNDGYLNCIFSKHSNITQKKQRKIYLQSHIVMVKFH
jgi:hypothetical protein